MNAADLLARYAARRDAEAFATLVSDYQSMVLATCRRRVRSPGDVDDAVQETFLKLAKNAGTLRTNVAAWLHRSAINVSTDLNRRGEARARHESAAFAGDVASGDAQRELAELREHLDAALDRLEENDRELILQRFFVGRSQVDIAKEEGVSASAISQRLDRAIAALRGHLSTMGAVAIGGTLATLLSAEQASAAVPSALTAQLNSIGLVGAPRAGADKGIAASTWAGAAAAVVVIGAAVGATIWFGHQSAAPIAGVVDAATQPAGGMTIRGDAPIGAAPSAPTWDAKTAAPGGALSGRITDADGKPIAGANVVLSNVRTGPVKTDADGRYSFATVPREGLYRLAVNADGFASIDGIWTDRDVPLRLAPGAQAQRDVVLQRAVKVTVVVDDVGGAALQDAQVSYVPIVARNTEAEARTNDRDVPVTADGIATMSIPVGDKPYAIMVSAKDHAPQFVRVIPKHADEPLNVPVTLEHGVSLTGTAICSDGKPGAGWSISARPVDWPWRNYPVASAKIDDDGKFTVKNAVPGKYDLSFMIPTGEGMWSGRPLGQFELSAAKSVALSLPMKSPGALATIRGKIKWVGDTNAPDVVYGASISAYTVDGKNYYSTSLRTDLKKRPADFQIANVEPGEYQIRFEGTTIEQVTLEHVKIPGDLPDVELRAARKSRLAGVVTDADTGKPVRSFAFRLRKVQSIGNGPNYVPSDEWTQVSDKEGTFTGDLVGPGEYQAQISAPGYAWMWSPSVRVETLGANGMVEVKLSRGGSVRGVVRDLDGKPVAGAKVIPFSMAQALDSQQGDALKRFVGEAGAAVTDAEGRYELKNLAIGGEALKVSHRNFAPTQLDITVVANATSDVPAVTLNAGATIAGTVYGIDGKPLANASIQFQDRFGYSGGTDSEAGRVAQATTDAAGRYRVAGVPDGTMLYANDLDAWNRGGVVRRLIRANAGRPATLDFGGPNAVVGRLRNADGKPLEADLRVTLSTGDPNFGGAMAVATPDADGRFNFGGVPSGRYQLYVSIRARGADRMPVRDVTIGDGALDLGEVVNDRGRVTIAVTAEDPADVVAAVSLQTSEGMPVASFREDGGRWVCDDVPVGSTLAQVSTKTNPTVGSVAIVRAAGQAEQNVTLALPRRSATLHYVQPAEPMKTLACVIDADGSTWMRLGWSGEQTVTVPPGTYRITAAWTQRPREDVPPIVVVAGQTVDVTLPMANAPVTADVYVWSAAGALVTDAQVTLVDASGRVIAPVATTGAERATIPVPPGHYTARVRTAGGAVVERPIEVGWPALTTWTSPVACHVVLPE